MYPVAASSPNFSFDYGQGETTHFAPRFAFFCNVYKILYTHDPLNSLQMAYETIEGLAKNCLSS